MSVASAIGTKVRELRKAKGLTLEELAKLSDSSKSYIWELENSPNPRPSGEKLSKIAPVLGVTPEFLVNEQLTTPTATHHDEAFFRKYQAAKPEVKEKLNKILDVLDE